MTAAASSSSPPRRWLPLRFSLRVLLVAFTAFAVGFPIWYRWPFTEERAEGGISVVVGGGGTTVSTPTRRFVTTWRRQWVGPPLQHGPQYTYSPTDNRYNVTWYRDGQRHGPERNYRNGALLSEGIWENGRRMQGEFFAFDDVNSPERHRTYRDGWLSAIGNELVDQTYRDKMAAAPMARSLTTILSRQVKLPKVPPEREPRDLEHSLEIVSRENEIPLVLDRQLDPNSTAMPNWSDDSFANCLVFFAHTHGLVCNYHDSCLWLTIPERAQHWDDDTGVSDVGPIKGSALAATWNQPVDVHCDGEWLVTVLDGLSRQLSLEFDTSALPGRFVGSDPNGPAVRRAKEQALIHRMVGLFIQRLDAASLSLVTLDADQLPLKDVLALLLYKTGCRCQLAGDKLVILPPEESLIATLYREPVPRIAPEKALQTGLSAKLIEEAEARRPRLLGTVPVQPDRFPLPRTQSRPCLRQGQGVDTTLVGRGPSIQIRRLPPLLSLTE